MDSINCDINAIIKSWPALIITPIIRRSRVIRLMTIFSWGSVERQSIQHFNPYVICLWLLEWAAALGFSRIARWRASRDGGEKWGLYALLPVYEYTIMLGKGGMVLLLLLCGFQTSNSDDKGGYDATSPSFQSAVSLVAIGVSSWLCALMNVIVIFGLCAHSAGTKTMYRSVGLTILLSFALGAVWFLQMADLINDDIKQAHNATNSTVPPLWPSFSASFTKAVPGIRNMSYPRGAIWAAMFFWLGCALLLLGVAAVMLVWARLFILRQPNLAATLYISSIILAFGGYFRNWDAVRHGLTFNAGILILALEMPVTYWVMLSDSRVRYETFCHLLLSSLIRPVCRQYWSSLSLDGHNSRKALDMLTDPWMNTLAVELMSCHSEMSLCRSRRAPHIPWTR